MRNTIQIATKEKKVPIINLSYFSYKHNTYYIFGPHSRLGMAWLTCIKFSPLRVPVKY